LAPAESKQTNNFDLLCNLTKIYPTSSRILLDTSEENKSDYVEELRKVLKKLDVRLETVLISHWHHDHVGSAGAIHGDKNMHADHGA